MDNTKFITKWLESKVRQAKEQVEREIEKIPKDAQKNYDKFFDEVASDDPYVFVKTDISKTSEKTTYTIQCIGNQVLFIEFGAGQYFYTENETRLYQDYMPNHRPSGISNIGEYGMGRGKDDVWFYKSRTGRESENAHLVKYNKKGEPIMITHGNRPSRSLYRAVGMAKRRLFSQKIKKIAPPSMN